MSIVSKKNVEEFRSVGATVLRGFWGNADMDLIDRAISDVATNPSPMVDVFERNAKGTPLFFNDFNNWRRIPSLRAICLDRRIGEAFCELTGSHNAYFFHDHVICKSAGAEKRTPWHIDKSYFMVDGEHSASFWTPTVDLSREQALTFAKGSHVARKLLMPKGFKQNEALESADDFLPFSESAVDENFDSVSWDMKRGDVVVFNFYTIHSAPSCSLPYDRKALSLRLFGDGTTFDARVKNPAPPFTQMGYKSEHGDPIKEAWFPKYD